MQKNTGVYLILAFPVVITLCIGAYLLYRNSHAIGNSDIGFDYNPWKYVLARHIFQFYSLLYPILTSILCFSICDVEFKNRGYKIIFMLPVERRVVFFSKLIFIMQTLLLSIIIAFAMFILAGLLFNNLLPGYGFREYDPVTITLVYFARLFAGLLTITMIQLTLSLAARNFVIPIAFACVGSFCALIMQRWDYIEFVPYHAGWQAFNGFAADQASVFTKTENINFAYTCLFLIASFVIFNRSKA